MAKKKKSKSKAKKHASNLDKTPISPIKSPDPIRKTEIELQSPPPQPEFTTNEVSPISINEEFDKLADEIDSDAEIVIPSKSIAREIETENCEVLNATHEPVQIVKPSLVNTNESTDFDIDAYFSDSEDHIEVKPVKGMIRKVENEADLSPLVSPVLSPTVSPIKELSLQETEPDKHLVKSKPKPLKLDSPAPLNSSPWNLSPKSAKSIRNKSIAFGSPQLESPNKYRYAQSPLPVDKQQTPPIFGVCVVGFHHTRGPEVEYWVGPDHSHSKIWPYLPFQSLPDGSHQFEENICYFTLLYDRNKRAATSLTFKRDDDGNIKHGTSDFQNVTTLFAIACSRQTQADKLPSSEQEEYSRTIVQKSVVVIASKPIFGPIKEKLAVVTRSYFQQNNFEDKGIINHFYENMMQMPMWVNLNDFQVGMNLQKFVHDFGNNVLVILKAMLLEKKILFYAQDSDVLGTVQFALISLVPNLISHLEDSGSPLLSSYELNLRTPQSFNPVDKQSLIDFVGFPLQLFGGGGVFAPFVPLQQLDELMKPETQYGLIGTTNNLFLNGDVEFDLVVNIDLKEVQLKNQKLQPLLKLSEADVAFMQNIQLAVNKAWDTEEVWQPESLGYHGGEDYIRHEFEEYLLALLVSAKYAKLSQQMLAEQEEVVSDALQTPVKTKFDEEELISEPSINKINLAVSNWNKLFVDEWMAKTNNFRIFNTHTVDEIIKVGEKTHPGVQYIKPTSFQRFLGLFNRKQPSPSSSQTASQTASPVSVQTVQTPVQEFEPQTPQHLVKRV